MQDDLFKLFELEISKLSPTIVEAKSNGHPTKIYIFPKNKTPPQKVADISFYISPTHYFRGTHPDNLKDVIQFGIDTPDRAYTWVAVEGIGKAIEYGDTIKIQMILVYERRFFTHSLGRKNENYPKSIFKHEIEYDGEIWDSSIPPEIFSPGYDFIYSRTSISPNKLHPTMILLFVQDESFAETLLQESDER